MGSPPEQDDNTRRNRTTSEVSSMEAAGLAAPEAAQHLSAQDLAAELALADPESSTFEGPTGALPERDREILAFERQWWRYAGAKEQAIRELFGMSANRYYQILNALIDHPDALAYDPMLVKRLRRLRAARQRARSARRLGLDA